LIGEKTDLHSQHTVIKSIKLNFFKQLFTGTNKEVKGHVVWSTFPMAYEQPSFWYVVESSAWRKLFEMCLAYRNTWRALQLPVLHDSTISSVAKKHLGP